MQCYVSNLKVLCNTASLTLPVLLETENPRLSSAISSNPGFPHWKFNSLCI